MNATTTPEQGPSLPALSTVYVLLFAIGVILSTKIAGQSYVSPFAPEDVVLTYFKLHSNAVRVQAMLVLASAIPLGIYVATVASRLRALGARVPGVAIALYGGFGASFMLAISGMAQWVLSRPTISTTSSSTLAWQDFASLTGGPAYACLLGLLIAGISVPSYVFRLLPRWLCIWGLFLALLGQLSILTLEFSKAFYLVPATRFPGFAWLIICGFLLGKQEKLNLDEHSRD